MKKKKQPKKKFSKLKSMLKKVDFKLIIDLIKVLNSLYSLFS